MKLVKKHLQNGQYLTQEFEKLSQFLHHTAGMTADGALSWWDQTPDRVGTPFVIDRDGTDFEAFDPKMWAYHLGVVGDDNWHEKHSINIEIACAGQLYLEDDKFMFYPLFPNKVAGKVIPKEDVYTFDEPYKGFKYYHKYTDAQIVAVKERLVQNLKEFPLLTFPNDPEDIFDYDESVVEEHKVGIWAHSKVRKDKNDVYPYPPLIAMLKEVKDIYNGVKAPKTAPEVVAKKK